MRLIGLVLLLAGLPIFSFGQMLSPEVVATSGDYYSSPYLTLSVTIGEPVSETVSNDEHTLNQGFQQGDYTVNQVEETGNSPGNIRVFPNPASDFLNIVIESPLEEAITMVLADANGKILKEITTAKSISELDISTFASGPMFLRITTQSGYSRTLKIQKIKK